MDDQQPNALPEPAVAGDAGRAEEPAPVRAEEPAPPSADAVEPSVSRQPVEGPADTLEPGASPGLAERSADAVPPPGAAPRSLPGALGYLAAAAAGGLLVGLLIFAIGPLGAGNAAPSPTPRPSPSAVPSATPASTAAPGFVDGQAVGRPDAPVTITLWADYQCPFCRLEAFAFGGALEREYAASGKARIVFRDYAFLGQESIDAAVAARCAGRQTPGAYWRYHDLLFLAQQGENQGAFARQNLVALAGIAGLDAGAFGSCLDDPAVLEAVRAETVEGGSQGVQSTPTTVVTGPGPVQVLRGFTQDWSVIADAIERAATPGATPTPTPAASSPVSPGTSPGASPGASGAPPPGPSAGASAAPSP